MTDLSRRAQIHTGTERRSCAFQLAEAELRGAGSPSVSGWELSAYASVTESPYTVYDEFGSFVETVHRGSFADTLSHGPDVVFLTNHTGLPLGRTRSGTLQLNEDTRGLRYKVGLDPESPTAAALRSAVSRRDITESSFAFKTTKQQWSPDYSRRSIYAVDLARGDVSACTYGASPATGAEGAATTLRDESRAPLHSKFLGTHTHRHRAMGSQGGDRTHSHSHSHDGDSSHDHHAEDEIVDADLSDDSTDNPSGESLALLNHDLEARLRILRLRSGMSRTEFEKARKAARYGRTRKPGETAREFAARQEINAIIAKRKAQMRGNR